MKTLLATLAFVLVLGPGFGAGEIRAQTAPLPGISRLGAELMVDSPGTLVGASTFPVSEMTPPARTFPYSYYAAFPGPARVYAPYGGNDIFAFTGQAYGHPYDRWSWSYLSDYPNSLNRYYYPPVR